MRGLAESATPTPYAVLCTEGFIEGTEGCGLVYMTEACYEAQVMRPNSLWRCPRCGNSAQWDDDNYEKALGIE